MAKIPTQYDLGAANPRAEQVGSGVSGRDLAMLMSPGNALSDLGKTMGEFGLKLKKAEDEADAYTAKKQFYDFTLERESDLYESEKNMEPGGKNFQADYASRYDESAKNLIERTPQRMRGRVEAMVAQHRSRSLQGALRAETVEMDRYETEQLDVTVNNSLDRIMNDPTEATARADDIESIIRDSHLSNRAKAKLLNGDARSPSIRQRFEEAGARAMSMKALSDGDTATVDRLERDLRRGIGDARERDPLTAPMDEDTGEPSAAERRQRSQGILRGPNGELKISPVDGPRPPPSWGDRRSAVEGVVVHHTAGSSLSGAIDHGRRSNTGTTYYVDRDGSIKQWTDEGVATVHMRNPSSRYRTDHGQASRRLTNDNTIGIEVVARNDRDVTPEQREALNVLVDDIVKRNSLDINNVVGHGELQGGRGGNREADEGTAFAKEFRSRHANGFVRTPPKTGDEGMAKAAPETGDDMVIDPDTKTRVASSRQSITDESPPESPQDAAKKGIMHFYGRDNATVPVDRGELPPAKDDVPTPKEQGNIDLSKRPTIKNKDGSVSTIKSTSVNIDGREYLLPTIDDDGTELDTDGAIERFKRTGEHLGTFDTPEQATAYAKSLSAKQGERIASSQDILGSDRQSFNGAVSQQPDMTADEVLSKDTINRIAEKHPGINGESTLAEIADRIGDKSAEEASMFPSLRLDQKRKLLRELLNNKSQAYSAKIASSKKEMENDIAHIARTGEPMPFDEEQARRWVTPNQWQKYKYDRRIAEMEWAATGNIQNMNESDGLQHLEKLKDWVDSEKDDDLYKRKVMIFEKAQKKWTGIEEERVKNPGSAVKDDPGVQAAISAFRQSGGQEGLAAVVEARLAAQRRMGITEDPLTNEEARALVARFNLRSLTDRNFEASVKALASHIQNRYGLEHASAVFTSVLKQQFGSADKARVVEEVFEREGRLMPGRINEEAARKAQERLRALDQVDAETGAFDPARAFQRPSGQAEWDRADYSRMNAFGNRGVTTTGPEVGSSVTGRSMQTSPPAGADFLPSRPSGWFDRGSSPSLNARRAGDKDYWPKPTKGALEALQKDPGQAEEFDRKFGPGAAARAIRTR